jgi:hypothetical protein
MVELVVDRFYVDRTRQIARKVICADDLIVSFISYHLDTGKSDGNISQGLRKHFVHWVDHEALANELADLQSRMME